MIGVATGTGEEVFGLGDGIEVCDGDGDGEGDGDGDMEGAWALGVDWRSWCELLLLLMLF